MRFPVFVFVETLVIVIVLGVLTRNVVALGFLIPAFLVCSVVALLNLAARKFNRASSLR